MVSALRRDDAVVRARSEMVEHASLVPGERLDLGLPEPHAEHARPTLLDVDDVARCEIDQRGRHCVVGHAEPVCQEVDDSRRLVAEIEGPRADRRLRRRARDQERAGCREPTQGGRDRDEREEEIRIAEQTEIVSAEADGR